MFNLTLENFTGPLDVLLGLIEEKKLPIHEVSLATVADSFLQYVQTYAQSRPNLSNVTYYLVVAATLVLIKSRSLLPNLELSTEEEQSIEDLELQLKLLKIFKEGGKVLHERWGRGMLYERARRVAIPVFAPDARLTPEFLKAQFEHVLQEVPKPEVKQEAVIREVVHLHDIMDSIDAKIKKGTSFTFADFTAELFERFANRLDEGAKKSAVVVSFLALLEMVRNGELTANQDGETILVAPGESPRV